MDSSADRTGSESVAMSQESAASAHSGQEEKAAEVHAAAASEAIAPAKAEAAMESSAAGEAKATESVKPAIAEISEPIKIDAAKEAKKRPATEARDATAARPAPGSALIKFVPAAERSDARQGAANAAARPNRKKSLLAQYGSRAALVAVLLGGGYFAGAHYFQGEPSPKTENVAQAQAPMQTQTQTPQQTQTPAQTAVVGSDSADRAELRRATQQMSEDIRGLKASLDSLRSTVAQLQNDDTRATKKGLDGVKSGLDAFKAETNTAIAQLGAKLDHMQREQATKLQQALDKAERAEQKANNASLTTSSVPPAQQALNTQNTPPKPPQTQAALQNNATDPQKKTPPSISNWVVRDVYDGIALVEGPGGAFEVMQGETIPGVGVVKSIERRGNGWIVVTNRGLVEMARE
jgi:hypothetical protein